MDVNSANITAMTNALSAPRSPRPQSAPEAASADAAQAVNTQRRVERQNAQDAIQSERLRAASDTESPGTERVKPRMRVDADIKRVITQIIGADEEVVKQIPPEEMLEVLKRTRELRGLLFDELV